MKAVNKYSNSNPRHRDFFQYLLAFLSIVLFGFLLFQTYNYFTNPAVFAIRHLKIEDPDTRADRKQLSNLINMALNGNFFTLDLLELRSHLLAVAWVEDVDIRRLWPDTLEVRVSEQKPVARWNEKELINEKGELFTVPEASVPVQLVALKGPDNLKPHVFAAYQFLQGKLENHGLQLQALSLDARAGWHFVVAPNVEVVVGSRDFDVRVNRFLAAYPPLLKKHPEGAHSVDLRYPNGMAVRWIQ